jgi:hypothetical protein
VSVDVAAGMALDHPALLHDAPYVREKLLDDGTADSPEEAVLLLREVLRYLVLARADRRVGWPMFSLRVDAAWHQFVLFTAEYAAFCARAFGTFVHHAPSNAPMPATAAAVPRATFDEFAARYRVLFGEEVPEVWFDEHTVTADRRLVNKAAGRLAVVSVGGRVELRGADGRAVLRAGEVAAQALRFVAATRSFHVRELPGPLTDPERTALAATLVGIGVLRALG